MSSCKKLTLFLLLLGIVAVCGIYAVKKYQQDHINPQVIGLEWMREEYQLDDATFAKICVLHESYYAERSSMTDAIDAADRPIIDPTYREKHSPVIQQAALKIDQVLCDDFEAETIRHLQQVAALMKTEQGERFLQDMAQSVHVQRVEHQRMLKERAEDD
jgi:hypothetical protein